MELRIHLIHCNMFKEKPHRPCQYKCFQSNTSDSNTVRLIQRWVGSKTPKHYIGIQYTVKLWSSLDQVCNIYLLDINESMESMSGIRIIRFRKATRRGVKKETIFKSSIFFWFFSSTMIPFAIVSIYLKYKNIIIMYILYILLYITILIYVTHMTTLSTTQTCMTKYRCCAIDMLIQQTIYGPVRY